MRPTSRKCIFLDRDGVLNQERGDYSYDLSHFKILPGVPEAIRILKEHGYLLVVITNQGGIARGLFSRSQMHTCHDHLQALCQHALDAIYYSPYHPIVTQSLSRKPDTLLFEKAIAKFHIDVEQSWMLGDHERDIQPAQKMGIRTIKITEEEGATAADFRAKSLLEAVKTQIIS